MSVRILLIALIALCSIIATVTTTSASLGLTEVYHFEIPSLVNQIKAIEFSDIDGDSWPEVLATDRSNLVLYSPASDSLLYQLDLDSALETFGFADFFLCGQPQKVLLADVNRDSLPDAVILAGLIHICYEVENGPLVILVDNVLSAEPTVTVTDLLWPSEGTTGILQAYDSDHDGYPELTLSADSGDVSYDPLCAWVYSGGRTRTYYSFPDSIASSTDRLIARRKQVELSDGAALFAAAEDSIWLRMCYPDPTIYRESTALLITDSSGAELANVREQVTAFCSGNYSEDTYNNLTLRAVGNIDDRNSDPEILLTYYWQKTCIDTAYGHNFVTYDTRGAERLLLRLVAADSVAEVWRTGIDECWPCDYYYHAGYPGTFFFVGDCFDMLYQHSGLTGRRLKSIPNVPDGWRFWGRPFGDSDILDQGGPDYFIAITGYSVGFYALGELTDVVDNPTADILPTTFTLGQPYPNPFNPTVTLPITLHRRGHLKVEVYNPLGQKVAQLYDGKAAPGDLDIQWDASRFASGVYFFKTTLDDLPKIAKAVLVK